MQDMVKIGLLEPHETPRFTPLNPGVSPASHTLRKKTPSERKKSSSHIMPYLATAQSYLEQSSLLISARPTTVRHSPSLVHYCSLTSPHPTDQDNDQIHNLQTKTLSLTLEIFNIFSPTKSRVFGTANPITAKSGAKSDAHA